MKNISHKLVNVTAWMWGAVFFFVLMLYMAGSFLTGRFRKIFKWKGLSHFRENDFDALNVIHDSEKNISIGKLPVIKGETSMYHLPLTAKEILLEFKVNASINSCAELDYCLSSNDGSFRKEFVYIFMNPFTDSPGLSYNKTLLWYPVPGDRILKVQFTDVKSEANTLKNIEGHLNIIQVR